MKILILTDYYPPDKLGGVGEIAKNLKESYENAGHKTWVITTGKPNGESRVMRSFNNLILGVFVNNYHAVKLIRSQEIDIVNLHQSSTTLFLFTKYIPFLYKKFPKIVNSFQVSYFSEFYHIRSIRVKDRVFRPTIKEYIEKWVYSPIHIILDYFGYVLADEVTVVSTENRNEFENTYGRLSKKKIKIIPNGVDVEDFSPKQSLLSKEFLNKINDKTVLLYVGVFRVRKRVFNLIYALSEVVSRNDDVVLVLVGGGRGYEEDIIRLINDLGLQDNVIFVGKIPNYEVVHYLNSSDVFCLLSSYEGMPIAVLEAMANGKAVLTTNVSGMVDLIKDGETGHLVEVDNIEQTTDKINSLLKSHSQIARVGENARKHVLEEYDWKIIASRYIELFKS